MPRLKPLVWMSSIAAVLAAVPVLGAAALAADPVVVRPGDTLTAIAERSGVPIERIVQVNRISDPNRIYVGQELRLEAGTSETGATAGGAVIHTVQPGDSVWAIARQYGISVAAVVEANDIADPSRIFAGQQLRIGGTAPTTPGAAGRPAAPAAPEQVIHVVRRGESLWGIANAYGSSVGAVAAANGIADPSRIFGGQRLVIPAPTSAAPAAGSSAPRMPPSMVSAVAERDAIRRMIVEEASAQGVPAALALAVAWQESGWRQGIVSYAGAIGVMQLLPMTADWVGSTMLGMSVDVHDARDNIRAGVRLLAHYMARYGADSDLVLAAYYQGQSAADRHGIYPVSRPYIASVRALMRIFGG